MNALRLLVVRWRLTASSLRRGPGGREERDDCLGLVYWAQYGLARQGPCRGHQLPRAQALGGHRLNGDPNVVFKSDAATELVKAAERLCCTTSPSVPRDWPHATHVEREIRAVKEIGRPIHLQAGFNKKMWPISVVYTAKSRAFWSPCVISVITSAEQRLKSTRQVKPVGMSALVSPSLASSTRLVHWSSTGQRQDNQEDWEVGWLVLSCHRA